MKKYLLKILYLTTIIALVLCLGACAKKDETTDTKPAVAESTANEPSEQKPAEETAQPEVEAPENDDSVTEETPKTEEENDDKNEDSEKEEPKNDTTPDTGSETPESKVATYVRNNGASLASRLQTELATQTGISSVCTVTANGTRIVFTCKLTGYNDLTDGEKMKIKFAALALNSTASTELSKINETEPEVSGADFKICEEDGDLITTVSVSK